MSAEQLHEAIHNGAIRIRQRTERIAFLRWNPDLAGEHDVRFLAERVQELEAWIEKGDVATELLDLREEADRFRNLYNDLLRAVQNFTSKKRRE